ncbi:hypothetical protein K3495_g14483 [Podosphaera aphanis]|nr:hypothetical protein K3495_g14483 [Podosphaera aphanis]
MKFTTIFTAMTTLCASVQLGAAEYLKVGDKIDCGGTLFSRSDALYSASGGMDARRSSRNYQYPQVYDSEEDLVKTPLSRSPYYPSSKCRFSNYVIMDSHGVIYNIIDGSGSPCRIFQESR